MNKVRGLISPKFQYYLLGLPLSICAIVFVGCINAFYSDETKWGIKYTFKAGIFVGGILLLLFIFEGLLSKEGIFMKMIFPTDGVFHPVSYIIFTSISLHFIKIQDNKFHFMRK